MQFKVNSKELEKVISKVFPGVPSRTPVQILENFLFILKDGVLTVYATDLELSLKSSISVVSDGDFEGEEFDRLKSGLNNLRLVGDIDSEDKNMAIQVFKTFTSIPEHLKLKLHFWGESLLESALVYPHKTFEVFQKEIAQSAFKYLLSVILYQYLL